MNSRSEQGEIHRLHGRGEKLMIIFDYDADRSCFLHCMEQKVTMSKQYWSCLPSNGPTPGLISFLSMREFSDFITALLFSMRRSGCQIVSIAFVVHTEN